MPGRPFKKSKLGTSLSELTSRSEYMDAGEMEVVAAYTEIPEGNSVFSQYYKFGCLPWRLQVTRFVSRDKEGKTAHSLKVTLLCDFTDGEWTAKASGTLTMKKWKEKLPKGTDMKTLDEHHETFVTKFNNVVAHYNFIKEFPISIQSGFSHSLDPYMKNRQVRFRLEFILHNVHKNFFPVFDFNKNIPGHSANAEFIVGDPESKKTRKFYVHKEFLSMYSDGFKNMFENRGFSEHQDQLYKLPTVMPEVFQEFLSIIYPSHKRPTVANIRGLLELARMYFIPTVTGLCEQRLLLTYETELSIGERLKLADEYGLLQLKAEIMQKGDASQLKDLQGLQGETLQILVRKLQNRDVFESKKQRKADEAMEVDVQKSHHRHRGTGGSGRRRY